MRKILITLAIVVALTAAISILWVFGGRQLSLLVDQFKTIETSSEPITSLVYQGNATGGTLIVNQLHVDLTPTDSKSVPPNVGTTKDEQFALSFGGKVFAFGPSRSTSDDVTANLATEPPAGDDALIATRHSALSWPTPLDFNFMTGQSPSWKRHLYYRLSWKKPSGAKLEMLWRFEQYCYSGNGWASGLMTREGSTGLIRVNIQN